MEGKSAAISWVAYTVWMRDYARELIPDIKFIHIKVDIPTLLPRNRIRLTGAMAKHGMTLEDMWNNFLKASDKEMYGPEYSDDNFDKYMTGAFY